ncbi:MAG: molybdopterin oxidoreductase [Bdellovibrio sp.]|nr:molybdopterin oxidoreductase [Bdellovibrio sp.]
MLTAEVRQVKNPGSLIAAPSVKTMFLVFSLIGVVTFMVGLFLDPKRMWFSFLHNHFYFLTLALGGLFFAALQWLTQAMWSAPVRRISEALTSFLPISLITFLILLFGIHYLYPWSYKGDIVLAGKSGYLNISFFVLRNLLAIGLWVFFAIKMIGNSLKQDKDSSLAWTNKNRVLSPIFIILFAITYTMVSFDQLMSLDPHWFSTIFGVYCFAGLFYSNLALTCVLTILLKRQGYLEGIVNKNHLHDLGKFMFAFIVFWAYIAFCQFMLIWYANLPEETSYFLNRMHGGWIYVSLFLLIGKFIIPFFILLPRGAKRNEKLLFNIGIYMLVAQWIDFYWIIQPQYAPDGPVFGLIEIGILLGFLGIFGLVVQKFLSTHNLVAIGDPRLVEAVTHHYQ